VHGNDCDWRAMMLTTASARLACGIDLVDIAAFGRALDVTKGRMGDVCFTDQEREQGMGRIDRLASRWAVKEAVAKALGVGLMQGIGFHDVEVAADSDGRPDLTLHGEAERLAAQRGLTDWAISIAHDGGLAMAFVVAMRSSGSAEARSQEEIDG
jgi:holo-[acyl-carrier protein] synthase